MVLEGVQWCWKGYSGVGRGTMVLEGVQWCWKGYNGVGKGLVGCSGGSGNGLGGGSPNCQTRSTCQIIIINVIPSMLAWKVVIVEAAY